MDGKDNMEKKNARRKPKRDRNGLFSFLKGAGGKFQVRRLIFALNVLYYTPTHLGEVPHLNSNLTHYLYTLQYKLFSNGKGHVGHSATPEQCQ